MLMVTEGPCALPTHTRILIVAMNKQKSITSPRLSGADAVARSNRDDKSGALLELGDRLTDDLSKSDVDMFRGEGKAGRNHISLVTRLPVNESF